MMTDRLADQVQGVRVHADEIGRAFAVQDDHTQAAIINAMGSWFKKSHRENVREIQICYMSDQLDGNGQYLVRELMAFLRLRDEAAEEGKAND